MLLWPQQYKDKHVLIWENKKKKRKKKVNSVSLVLHKVSYTSDNSHRRTSQDPWAEEKAPSWESHTGPCPSRDAPWHKEPLQPTIYSARYTRRSTRDESWPTCPPNHQQLPHKPSSVHSLWSTCTGTWGPWTPSASAGLPGILSALSSPHKPKQPTPTTPGAHKHAGEQPQIHLIKAASWICLCWSEGR